MGREPLPAGRPEADLGGRDDDHQYAEMAPAMAAIVIVGLVLVGAAVVRPDRRVAPDRPAAAQALSWAAILVLRPPLGRRPLRAPDGPGHGRRQGPDAPCPPPAQTKSMTMRSQRCHPG